MQNGTVFSVDFTTMGTILLVLIGLYTMGTVFNYIPQRILAGVSQKLILDLRKRISDKLNKLPLKYYDTHKKGQILSRITNDLERVADSVQETMANMITASITLIGAFLMMLMISPSLTLIALVTVIVSAVVSILIGSRTKQYHAANQAALGDLNANIEEAFTGNSLIKAFNLKKEMIMQNDVLNERLRKTSMKAQFITYVINPVVRLIGQFGYVLIAVRGAIAVISGEIRIGDVQAAFQYVNQISEPITQRVVERPETPLFDNKAFREAIINAVLHNLWVSGNEPMISVFSDRIEILSRGTLPPAQTMEGFFLGESVPVNEKLSEIFLQLHISEKSGRGVPKIIETYGREAFTFRENSIVVTIPLHRIKEVGNKVGNKKGLNARRQRIITEMRDNPNITTSELHQILGISETAVENNLTFLKENRYVERVGSKKTGYWKVLE